MDIFVKRSGRIESGKGSNVKLSTKLMLVMGEFNAVKKSEGEFLNDTFCFQPSIQILFSHRFCIKIALRKMATKRE